MFESSRSCCWKFFKFFADKPKLLSISFCNRKTDFNKLLCAVLSNSVMDRSAIHATLFVLVFKTLPFALCVDLFCWIYHALVTDVEKIWLWAPTVCSWNLYIKLFVSWSKCSCSMACEVSVWKLMKLEYCYIFIGTNKILSYLVVK